MAAEGRGCPEQVSGIDEGKQRGRAHAPVPRDRTTSYKIYFDRSASLARSATRSRT